MQAIQIIKIFSQQLKKIESQLLAASPPAKSSNNSLDGVNLRDISLIEANLSGISLRDADLGGVNFSGANLNRADLRGANLRRANLCGANIMDEWH